MLLLNIIIIEEQHAIKNKRNIFDKEETQAAIMPLAKEEYQTFWANGTNN